MSAETELNELEARVLAENYGGWLKAIDRLRDMLATGAPGIEALVLELVAPVAEAAVLAGMGEAFALGVADALDIIGDVKSKPKDPKGGPSSAARAIVEGVDKASREALAKTQRLTRAGVDEETALAPLFADANAVRGRVSDAINRGGNEGSTAAATRNGMATVWVAETSACVHCLAYAGLICKPGGKFPGGLTYGKKSYYPNAIKGPPRHPRCRCTVEPLRDKGYAEALQREAQRSVLRGFSLESESMAVRVDAARRLIPKLEPGVDAPKSVIEYARKAVEAGSFPTRDRPRS